MGEGAAVQCSYSPPTPAAGSASPPSSDANARALLEAHFTFIWRLLRRLGVSENDVEDAVQRVFMVASSKLERIATESERSFLFGIALRVASTHRRSLRRRPEVANEPLASVPDQSLPVDEVVARRQAIEIVDRIVASMPDDLRVIFVLCEIEELSVPDAAALQGIPVGTAASRLRRARETFHREARRTLVERKQAPEASRGRT